MTVAQAPIDSVAAPVIRERLRAFGAVRLNQVLRPAEVAHYLRAIRDRSGYDDASVADVLAGRRPRFAAPGTATQDPTFWPLIVHPGLVAALRAACGPDVRYLYGDSAFAHHSASGWHRDTAYDLDRTGPLFDPGFETWCYARIILFFHETATFRFAIRPGSHRPGMRPLRVGDTLVEDPSQMEMWIEARPGDAILFDGRILHQGEDLSGPRYGVTLSYGPPNAFNVASYFHHCIIRDDQAQRPPPDGLRDLLRAHDLFFEEGEDPANRERFEQMFAGLPRGRDSGVVLNHFG